MTIRRQLFLCLLLAVVAPAAHAQEFSWPFAVGEVLTYQVRISRLGDVGSGRMWVEGPVVEQGVVTWRLRFEMEAGKGPFHASDRTSSWLNPATFSIVRFEKRERHVLSRSDEEVRIDLAKRLWIDDDGASGTLGSEAPLDELSFMYFIRTLPLERDTVLWFDRHFDPERNPTVVRTVGRDTLTTPAGIFHTRIVEMVVRDPKRYRGTGIIRIHLNEGDCHMPVRIESRMPIVGVSTMTLTGWSRPPRSSKASVCG